VEGASFNPLRGSKPSAKDAQTSEDTVMRSLLVLLIGLLAGCSKSPMDATVDGANAAATRLMAPLVQKDASHQVEGLIRTIEDRPVCRGYIERLRDAGRGSPYEGATEMMIVHTYDAAGKAGCVKPN
jgi:hypothetical protein